MSAVAPWGRRSPSMSLVTPARTSAWSMAAVAEASRWRSAAEGLTNRLGVAVRRLPLWVAVALSRKWMGASARLLRAAPPELVAKRNSMALSTLRLRRRVLWSIAVLGEFQAMIAPSELAVRLALMS